MRNYFRIVLAVLLLTGLLIGAFAVADDAGQTASVGAEIAEAEAAGCVVFHAGTAVKDGKIVNSGGRVLVVSAEGDTVADAVKKAYEGVKKIRWEGVQYRSDIAWRAIERLK